MIQPIEAAYDEHGERTPAGLVIGPRLSAAGAPLLPRSPRHCRRISFPCRPQQLDGHILAGQAQGDERRTGLIHCQTD